MKRKKKVLGISLGVLIFLIIVGVVAYFGITRQTIEGSSLLSLSQVDLRSQSSYLDGQQWIMTIRGGGLGQYAEGDFSPEDVSEKHSGKETTEHDFLIDTEFSQTCVYPIVVDYSLTPTYKLSDPIEWTYIPYVNPCNEEEANERGCTSGLFGKYKYSLTCFCVNKIKKTGALANTPNFNNPSTESEMTIKIEAKGHESYNPLTLKSMGDVKGGIGDIAYVIWQGNLATGQVCGLPSSTTLPAYINGKWYLAKESRYNTYLNNYEDLINSIQREVLPDNRPITEDNLRDEINVNNNYADNFLSSRISFGFIEGQTSQSGAKIKKELSQLIDYPVLTMYVKASWLGIVTPVAQPKIKEISSDCFGAGERGRIKVKIANIGDERGVIDLYGKCPTNAFDIENFELTLNAGSERTIYMEVSGTSDQEIYKETCTITAESIELFDTAEIELCVEGYKICTANIEWCEDNKRHKCSSDGMSESAIEDCGAKGKICTQLTETTTKCEEINGNGGSEGDPCTKDSDCGKGLVCINSKCKKPTGECDPQLSILGMTIIPNLSLKCLFDVTGTFGVIRIIVAVLGAIIAGVVAFGLMRVSIFKRKKENTINIILSLIIGILIGFLIAYLFVIGIIVLIVLIIIKRLIRKPVKR